MLPLLPAELVPILPVNRNLQLVEVPPRVIYAEYTNFLIPGMGFEVDIQLVLFNCAGQTGVTSTPAIGF
jgi:hypothetical protein